MKAFPKRDQNSDDQQAEKNIFFKNTIKKLRSIAFQRCILRGGLPLVEVSQNEDFVQKTASKTAFLSITIPDQLTLSSHNSCSKPPNLKREVAEAGELDWLRVVKVTTLLPARERLCGCRQGSFYPRLIIYHAPSSSLVPHFPRLCPASVLPRGKFLEARPASKLSVGGAA